jgi:hypothetical protein
MLEQAPTMATCYDFSVIETAIQTVAETAQGDLAWLTGFEALALQKERPRIECYLDPGQAFGSPPHYVNTAIDGQRRINGWVGSLRTMVITPVMAGATEEAAASASYTTHNQYRSFVANILATIDQQLRDNAALLPYHQVARCWDSGSSPKIAPQTGVYTSELNHSIIYNIRPAAFPGGLLNAGQIPT